MTERYLGHGSAGGHNTFLASLIEGRAFIQHTAEAADRVGEFTGGLPAVKGRLKSGPHRFAVGSFHPARILDHIGDAGGGAGERAEFGCAAAHRAGFYRKI